MFAALTSTLQLAQTFAATTCSKPTFLGLVPWYQYLHMAPDAANNCTITSFNSTNGANGILGSHSPFLLIGLAIIDDLLRVAALVAVGFIITGGIQYMTSQGAPDMTKRAQQTIINALIGLAISIVSASIVAFIGSKLGG